MLWLLLVLMFVNVNSFALKSVFEWKTAFWLNKFRLIGVASLSIPAVSTESLAATAITCWIEANTCWIARTPWPNHLPTSIRCYLLLQVLEFYHYTHDATQKRMGPNIWLL